MARRQQPSWLTEAQSEAALLSVRTGIPSDDCFSLINPDSERDTERFIKAHLVTQEQKQWLFDNDYSLDDVLSGRVEGEEKQEQVQRMFNAWNEKLGKKVFG